MKIVVVNRTPGLVPHLPEASLVRLITNPLCLMSGGGGDEKLVAQRDTERAAVKHMLRRVHERTPNEEFLYYVEIENNLPQKLVMTVTVASIEGDVGGPFVIVEKGNLFGHKSGVNITMSGTVLKTEDDIRRIHDMLEMAKFIAYEVR